MSVQYLAPTKRRPMTKPRRTRIFLSRNGICCICGVQIKAHADAWIIEHIEAVALGGSDDDADLHPAHERCRREKDKIDAGKIAKRNTAIDKGYADKPKGRGFYRPPGMKFNWAAGRYQREKT